MRLEVGPLPDDPVAAAARFHAEVLPRVAEALADGALRIVLVFFPAPHAHRAWRVAAVQTLAAARAPARINGLASDDAAALAATETYLDSAPGLTGHYLELDGAGAGPVLG